VALTERSISNAISIESRCKPTDCPITIPITHNVKVNDWGYVKWARCVDTKRKHCHNPFRRVIGSSCATLPV
jgi:hypothetical protein